MNIRVSVKYCGRSLTAQINPKTTLKEIIQHTIDGGYAKQQMLNNPGVYISDRSILCTADDLSKPLEVYFPMISLQGPPVELLILRQEEFVEYEQAINSQPKLDNEPPMLDDKSQKIEQTQPIQQPPIGDLFPNSQMLNSGQQFTIQIKTTSNLAKEEFQLKDLTQNSTINDVKDLIFKRLGFYDRSIVDLDIYHNDQPLQGAKSNKTLFQLNILSGTTLEVKARWTGGNQA